MNRAVRLIAAAGLLLLVTAPPAPAQFSAEDIPGNPFLVISGPQLNKTYQAIANTSTYAQIEELFSDPSMAENLDYQKFLLEKEKLEVNLGFKLNGATLSQIIKGIDFAAYPSQPPAATAPGAIGPESAAVLLVRVSDPAKFDKLLAELEKSAVAKAKVENPDTANPVSTETYGGKTLKIVKAGQTGGASATPDMAALAMMQTQGQSFAWTMAAPDLLAAGDVGSVKATIDFLQKGGASLAKNQAFKAARAGLPQTAADLFFYLDYAKLLEFNSPRMGGPEALMLSSLQEDIGSMRFAAAANFESDKLVYHACSPFDANTGKLIRDMASKYPPTEMRSSRYMPVESLLASWGNSFDGEMIFDQMMKMLGTMAPMMGMDPSQGDPIQQLKGQLAMFELMLGFRVKEDLLMGIGPEIFLQVGRYQHPLLEATIGIQVRDNAKVQKVLTGVENLVDQPFGAADAGQAPPKILAEVVHDGVKIKYYANPMLEVLGYKPGYYNDGEFLVFGTSIGALQKAIAASKGKSPTVLQGAAFAEVKPYVDTRANSVMLMDSTTAMQTIETAVLNIAGSGMSPQEAQTFKKIMGALKTIGVFAGSSRITAQGQQARGVMLLAPKTGVAN